MPRGDNESLHVLNESLQPGRRFVTPSGEECGGREREDTQLLAVVRAAENRDGATRDRIHPESSTLRLELVSLKRGGGRECQSHDQGHTKRACQVAGDRGR